MLIFFFRVLPTRVKTHNLFRVDENSLKQCCAAHIVQCCQHYCSTLLHLIAGQFRLNNAEQYCWQHWTMWAAQHCSRLFSSTLNRMCAFTRVSRRFVLYIMITMHNHQLSHCIKVDLCTYNFESTCTFTMYYMYLFQ